MKSFNRLREESLEEKLKASDPTGKWISDFVHSDNPKFAGKSKKERIRMALGASYAAKRQNEDNNHIVEATHRIGLTVTDPNHPMVSKRKETIQKTVRMPGEDRENAIKRAIAHYRRKGYKVHDHHYIGTVNEEVELIEKYTENDIANGGTVIYKHQGKHYMSKVSHKTGAGAGTKIHTTSALGHVVPLHHVVSTDASDWNTYKNRPVKEEVEQIDELKRSTLASYANKAEKSYHSTSDAKTKAKRDVGLDRADRKIEKKDNAKNPFNENIEQIDELKRSTLASYAGKASKEVAKSQSYAAKFKKDSEFERDVGHPSRARVLDKERDVELKHAKKRQAGFDKALTRLAKEESEHIQEGGFDIPEIPRAPTPKPAPKDKNKIAEGSTQDKLYQQHQAIRTANKRPNPEYYKELGMAYDIKDDKERMAKQAEIKKKYKVEGAQLDQLKTMRDDPKWQENPEHKAQLDKRFKMAKDRADLDKGEVVDPAGKPVPVLTPDKFKEKNPNFMKEEGDYPHQGVGVSRSMQMAADIARQKARTSMMQSKYGNEFQDKAIPDYDEDKMDLKPGTAPGTYQATVRMRERMKQESFSSLRNKIAEAKKMKGEDPCWDDYKMIGTKTKNGREVPNCVPKESVAEGKEEQEYDYEGDMAMSDLRSILHNAKTVHDMLEPNTNIPEWCQSKITLAEDYISTVANYMRGEMTEEAILEASKPGLYANIHAKRKRIAKGSGERMRKPGTKGAPTAQAFKDSAKTAKK
jgi:hypothetical protein